MWGSLVNIPISMTQGCSGWTSSWWASMAKSRPLPRSSGSSLARPWDPGTQWFWSYERWCSKQIFGRVGVQREFSRCIFFFRIYCGDFWSKAGFQMFPVDFPLIQAMLESNSNASSFSTASLQGTWSGSGARYFRAHDVSSDLPGLEGNLGEPGWQSSRGIS